MVLKKSIKATSSSSLTISLQTAGFHRPTKRMYRERMLLLATGFQLRLHFTSTSEETEETKKKKQAGGKKSCHTQLTASLQPFWGPIFGACSRRASAFASSSGQWRFERKPYKAALLAGLSMAGPFRLPQLLTGGATQRGDRFVSLYPSQTITLIPLCTSAPAAAAATAVSLQMKVR